MRLATLVVVLAHAAGDPAADAIVASVVAGSP